MAVKTRILDLPADCLLPIFNKLSPPDLAAIFKAHKYFETVSAYIAFCRYKSAHIQYSSYLDIYVINQSLINYLDLKFFFEIFGPCIETLTLQPCDYIKSDVAEVLSLANSYCGGSVKYLALNCVTIKDKLLSFDEFFKNLNGLEIIRGIDDDTLDGILLCCENLKDLKVDHNHIRSDTVLKKIFRKLERIVYHNQNLDIPMGDVQSFLQTQPNLKVVNIENTFINSGFDALANVEVLKLDTKNAHFAVNQLEIDWSHLFRLKKLRQLKLELLHNISESLMKLPSKPSTSVEILQLNVVHSSNVFDLLNAITFVNLKILSISYLPGLGQKINSINAYPVVCGSAMEALSNLEEIHFLNFPCEAFKLLLEIVRASSALRTVVLFEKDLQCVDILCLPQLIQQKQKAAGVGSKIKLIIVESLKIWHLDDFNFNLGLLDSRTCT